MAHSTTTSSSTSTSTSTTAVANTNTTPSALFLKAKHAFSLHRKSSVPAPTSAATSSSSTSPSTLPVQTVSPPLSPGSTPSLTNVEATTVSVGGVVNKPKRHSRFTVKTFPSFRDRSISPPDAKTSHGIGKTIETTASSSTTAATATTTPSVPVVSLNPYSAAWCPSTVGALRSPLRSASSKSCGDQDLRPSHYSPAPNLILQPSPAVDLAPCYGTGARTATLSPQRCQSTAGGCRTPVIGPQDFLSKLPYEIATYILHFVDMHNLAKVALISRTWNQFARDNEVWKSIFLYQKQWKIRIPQPRPPHGPGSANTLESKQVQCKPLNWKMLCYDRKQLEERWKTMPSKKRLLGHSDSVYCVQFDHSKIVTGSRDHTIKFWDLHTLTCTHTLRGHSLSVLCLQFNDKAVVSGSSDTTIIVWDMETRQPIRRLQGHTAGVLDVCFDDQYIISCSKDTTIKVWDFTTGALMRTMTGHCGPVNAVQLHNGNVVSASGDCVIKLWDARTGHCLHDFKGHDRGLACIQFDGTTIVSGSNDKTIRIWDVATGRCLQVLTGHTDLVRTLHFEQNKIVSGSYDHTVKVWDMTTGQLLLDLPNGHSSWVFDVQFSSSRIISTSQDRSIIVWDFSGDQDMRPFD